MHLHLPLVTSHSYFVKVEDSYFVKGWFVPVSDDDANGDSEGRFVPVSDDDEDGDGDNNDGFRR